MCSAAAFIRTWASKLYSKFYGIQDLVVVGSCVVADQHMGYNVAVAKGYSLVCSLCHTYTC